MSGRAGDYRRLKGKEGGKTVTLWRDTAIEGKVLAKEDGLFFTSIPYDKGWTVTVDGQEIKGRKLMNAFLGFDLPAGEHELSFRYYPPGLKAGMAVSAVTVLAVAFAAWQDKKRPRPKEMGREESQGRKASRKKSRFLELDWLDDEPEEGIEDEEDLGEEGGWDNWLMEDMEPEDEGKKGRQENQNTGKEEAGKENRP